jgi:hypothetical protein
MPCSRLSAYCAGRPLEGGLKHLVEPPEAIEAHRQRNLGHGHLCLTDQLLCEQDPSCLCHDNRRRTEMLNYAKSPQFFLVGSFGRMGDA